MYKDSKAQTMVKYDPYENGSTMSIHNVPAKKVLLVARWSELKPLIDDMKECMLPIEVPDSDANEVKDKRFIGKYMLIMLATNEENNNLTDGLKWNSTYIDIIKRGMKVNLRGSSSEKAKHFGCVDKYYGFGPIAKYFGLSIVFLGPSLQLERGIG